ncbi:transmembrane protein [Ceratobasidium sp. AG-Ba]|nr:transmembrane protein [Ceratobasidium sp. AG-Ba]
MSPAAYTALPTSDHPQARADPTRESTAWFWNARDARSVQVEVITVESEPEEEPPRLPPSPQDAVFSNITPVRTEEVDQLERALADAGFLSLDNLSARRNNEYAPPQYNAAPSYEAVEEPVTLASYLFKYGFFFPLFWAVGAFIIISDLQQDGSSLSYVESQPPSPTAPKSPYELQLKREEMALLRLAELKWAWRCAYAFAIWFFIAITILAVVIGTGCVRLF